MCLALIKAEQRLRMTTSEFTLMAGARHAQIKGFFFSFYFGHTKSVRVQMESRPCGDIATGTL